MVFCPTLNSQKLRIGGWGGRSRELSSLCDRPPKELLGANGVPLEEAGADDDLHLLPLGVQDFDFPLGAFSVVASSPTYKEHVFVQYLMDSVALLLHGFLHVVFIEEYAEREDYENENVDDADDDHELDQSETLASLHFLSLFCVWIAIRHHSILKNFED